MGTFAAMLRPVDTISVQLGQFGSVGKFIDGWGQRVILRSHIAPMQ